jgi:eukaryotic-like serine/threonine-protein kinase
MTPERWQQITSIFNSAIKQRPEDRAAFISKACSGDSDLRNQVGSLIVAHEKDGSFIVDSPSKAMAGLIEEFLENETVELKAGQTVGSYQITSFISRGGMGEVYLAQDQRLRRKVALKILPSSVMKDADRLRRFEQEARAASALNHPNIITIYEIREADSKLIIATEFVEGETLRKRLRSGALELHDAIHVAVQIADALAAAHKAGIIHRDIKPENVMIRPDGYVKILDFGLVKLTETESTLSSSEVPTRKVLTGAGIIIGTVGYMSPEQARGQDVDTRSDIFNLGAVIYEMVAGQRPFVGDTTSDVLAAILKTDPPPLSHLVLAAPVELVRIVTKALRKDREERYQNVKDLLLDLKTLKEDLDFQAKLDRSVTPNKAMDETNPVKPEIRATGATSPPTSEIKSAVSTITRSISVEIKRHKIATIVTVLALAALIATGTIALYKSLTRPRPQPTSAPQVVNNNQVTFSSGLDGFPSISPDGKSVAYSSDQNGSFEIYVKQLGQGGGELQLTNDGKQNFQPSWSPDGQRIAYQSKGRGGIWLVSALGGSPRQLTEFGAKPAWSFNGSQIAFQSYAPSEINQATALAPCSIWIVSSSGGTPRQVTKPGNPPGGHSSPSWSPDGKRIVFNSSDYLLNSVWLLELESGSTKKIVSGVDPTFGPDGRYIYFVGNGLSKIQLSETGDPIGEPTTIEGTGPGIWMRSPSVSADGKQIAYSAMRLVSNLWTIPLSSSNADVTGPPSVFSPDTSQRKNLARFSPDGRRIALNRWRPGSSADIWVADADGRNLTQLTNNPATDSQASWFPDGDKIAFMSDRENPNKSFALWSISLSTSKEEKLLQLDEGVQFYDLSPDGNQIAFNYVQNGIINIWVASLKDGQRKQLTFDNDLMGFPCWSPDGKQMAFEKQVGENAYLMVMPSSGGQITQLTFGPGKSWPHSWSADGDKIVFAGQRNGVWNIYWISLSTKTQKQLTNYTKLNSFVRYPAWSPLGNQVVYEYAETTGNIWLLELK